MQNHRERGRLARKFLKMQAESLLHLRFYNYSKVMSFQKNTKFLEGISKETLESKKGLLLQILLVLLPPAFFLKNAYLLLLGLFIGVLLAWKMLRLRNKTWKDAGFRKPENIRRLAFITLTATAALLPLSFAAKLVVMTITGTAPNLDVFNVIQGNIPALAAGLVTAWIFGAFLEEFFFRGFLQNSLYELFSKEGRPRWMAWTGAVLITSVLTGIGHFYQGITGMVTAGFIAAGFSAVYLLSRRNLWSCILSHGLYDTVAFMLVYGGIDLGKL